MIHSSLLLWGGHGTIAARNCNFEKAADITARLAAGPAQVTGSIGEIRQIAASSQPNSAICDLNRAIGTAFVV
jgi:hypothetical protein